MSRNLLLGILIFPSLYDRACGIKRIEVVTLGLVTNATTISLHYLAPALDLAATRFRTDHGKNFNLTHTYLIDEAIRSCPDLASETSFMVAEWYYKKRTEADLYAFIVPGKRHRLRDLLRKNCISDSNAGTF